MINRRRLITVLIIFLAYCNGAQSQSDTIKRKKRTYDKGETIMSWNFGGVEFMAPRNLKHGFSVKNQWLSGPTLDLFGGMVKMSVLSGYYTRPDTFPGKEINVKTNRFGMSFNFPLPIIRSAKFNIVPHFGLGVFTQSGSDPFVKSTGDGGVFGFNVNPGLSLIVGPIKASACVYFEGGYSEKAAINRGLHYYPSFSIALSPQVFLFNPQVFSHTGMKHWIEDYNSYTITRRENFSIGYDKVTTTTYTSWTEMSAVKTATIKDVQPFLFIGPRIQTSFRRINQSATIPTYGFNMGFRSGTFYVNGFIDKGQIYFREPFKRNENGGVENKVEARLQRMDGYLTGATRVGAEIGLDLVTYFIKKGYDDQASFINKTSYYGIILKVGYSQQSHTGIRFFADSGSTYLGNFIAKNNAAGSFYGYKYRGDVRTAPSIMNNVNIGFVASVGAFAINYDYYMNKSLSVLSHSEVSICYHYPISRLIKAINVYAKTHKKEKKL